MVTNVWATFCLVITVTTAAWTEANLKEDELNFEARIFESCPQEGYTCKPASQCQLFVTESTAPELCNLGSTEGENAVGVCCSDVVPSTENYVRKKRTPGNKYRRSTNKISFEDLKAVIETAKANMDKLMQFEGIIGNNADVQVDEQSPASGHLKFFETSKEARELALQAMELLERTKSLKDRMQTELTESELKQVNIFDSRWQVSSSLTCPPAPTCPATPSKYRKIDGSCNNANDASMGQAMRPFTRLLPALYRNGVDAPRRATDGSHLVCPRGICSALSQYSKSTPQDERYTALVADFGQFIDHDMTLSPVFTLYNGKGIQCCERDGSAPQPSRYLHPECYPIKIPSDDEHFSNFDQRCMNFVRTMPALFSNCSMGARQQMNGVTDWIDMSTLYGTSTQQAMALRGAKGKLLTGSSSSILPPHGPSQGSGGCIKRRKGNNANYCFLSGDPRVNEQPLQASLVTIFMREHNRIADVLATQHPTWTSDNIYEETRRIVIAEIQHIIYNEFLPILLGTSYMQTNGMLPLTTGFSNDYDATVDGAIANEFSTAAFRLHTLVRGSLKFTDSYGRSEYSDLRHYFDSPQILSWPKVIAPLIRGQSSRPLSAFDHTITEDLTDYMFQIEDDYGQDTFGLDICSLNVNRGRDHGLSGYNAYRQFCGLPKATDFSDLYGVMRPEALKIIKKLYCHVDDIDLFIGGTSELPASGAILGPMFQCIVGNQFKRSKKGDRYFYEVGGQPSSFSSAQLQEIRKVSLARILCDNTDINQIQPLPLKYADMAMNAIVSCTSSSIASVNLGLWSSETPE